MSRVSHESLYRALINRLDALHLAPGDVLTVTFPAEVYESNRGLRDAERFAQQVASLVKHDVVILKEGVELAKYEPKADFSIATIDEIIRL